MTPPLVESLGALGDPAEVARRFLDLPYVLLLDSATGALPTGEAHPLGRFSFLTADPAIVVRSKGTSAEIGRGAGRRPIAARDLGNRALGRAPSVSGRRGRLHRL